MLYILEKENAMKTAYRAPSVKTLQQLHWISDDQRETVRKLISGIVLPDSYQSVSDWVAHCYNEPSWIEQVMVAIDEVIDTHGVETIWHKGKVKCEYCNIGDTYAVTIVYRYDLDRFQVVSWGDLVEQYNWNGEQ
jgi:hypothetical protein